MKEVAGEKGTVRGSITGVVTNPRDPNGPMEVIFTDFRAQCRYYLYTWIPMVRVLLPGPQEYVK